MKYDEAQQIVRDLNNLLITDERCYLNGYLDALWNFAYMKDGIYYVGTTGHTLSEVLDKLFEKFTYVRK